ncbi:MAG TPA: hypothetical protein VHR36_03305 [Pyrinomonadaceae bacterium]|nr:hypothetical protein [Pyrinomonadaceae bacterium]
MERPPIESEQPSSASGDHDARYPRLALVVVSGAAMLTLGRSHQVEISSTSSSSFCRLSLVCLVTNLYR